MKKRISLFCNSLDFRVRISLIVVSIIPLLIYLFSNRMLISRNFLNLEKRNIQQKAVQADSILKSKAIEMERMAKDYGIWDEAYQKSQENDTEWFEDNFSRWLPNGQSVDLIVVVDKNKKVLDKYQIGEGNIPAVLEEDTVKKVLRGDYDGKYENYPNGLLELQGELYIVGVCPILEIDCVKPSQGAVILGKKVTPKLLGDIRYNYGYRVSIFHNGRIISMPEEYEDAKEYFTALRGQSDDDATLVERSNIMTSIPFRDISNKNIGFLSVVESREMFLSTLTLIHKNGVWILAVSILSILLMIFQFRKMIANPIKNLERQLTRMVNSNTLDYVSVKGASEIVNLAATFNQMTDSIKSHKRENESLRTLSITDSLTSLYNHRYFFEFFEEKTKRGNRNICVIFCDIDHFKIINYSYGHITGDMVLREIGDIIRDTVDGAEGVFRYGGEEFAVILEDSTLEQAYAVAERIRLKVSNSKNVQAHSRYLPLTVSIGIASYPSHSLSAENLIEKADKAMYFAKQNGRNQSVIYKPELEEILDKNYTDFNKKEMMLNSVFALTAAIDAKDNYTEKHSESVAKYALLLAEKIGMQEKDKYVLRIGGLLHDLGKIGTPDDIIHKPGALTEDEWKVIKNHTLLGSNIIRHVNDNPEIEACIRYHHERWDGRGYPEGIAGHSIPIYARIICIGDSYHAMISDRPYRKGLTQKEALKRLNEGRGTQFDPALVGAFIEAILEEMPSEENDSHRKVYETNLLKPAY